MPAEPRYLQEILAQVKLGLHFPNARGAFGSPPGGFHILGGNEFRLRIKLGPPFVSKYRKDIRTPQAALAVSQSTDQYPSAHNGLVF